MKQDRLDEEIGFSRVALQMIGSTTHQAFEDGDGSNETISPANGCANDEKVPMSARTQLTVRNLSKVYRKTPAVERMSFELSGGSVCGLVGPNGAGKSTTMRCVSGLMAATAGKIQIDDSIVLPNDPESKRWVVYVPDDPPLFDDLTVMDHLYLACGMYQRPDSPLEWLLNQFDLTKFQDRSGSELSRGMRQKLALCMAAIADPSVFVLDEPMTGLDPPGIRVLMDFIRRWQKQGKIVLVSSHLLEMIAPVCSHVLFIESGTNRFFGTKSQLEQAFPEANSFEEAYFAALQ